MSLKWSTHQHHLSYSLFAGGGGGGGGGFSILGTCPFTSPTADGLVTGISVLGVGGGVGFLSSLIVICI